MCDGATDEERKEWDLLEANEFKYLNKSSTYSLAGVDNAEEYRVRPHPRCLPPAASLKLPVEDELLMQTVEVSQSISLLLSCWVSE